MSGDDSRSGGESLLEANFLTLQVLGFRSRRLDAWRLSWADPAVPAASIDSAFVEAANQIWVAALELAHSLVETCRVTGLTDEIPRLTHPRLSSSSRVRRDSSTLDAADAQA